MGGAENLTYTSGWQTRGHVSAAEDTLFSNIADEDFIPSQEMKVYGYTEIDGQGNANDADIVVSCVNLQDFYGNGELSGFGDWANKVFSGKISSATADAEAQMYWPAIRSCRNITTYYCDGDSYFVPSTGAYDYNGGTDDGVKKALNKLFSMGQLSLQSSYKLPGKWLKVESSGQTPAIEYLNGDTGAILGITGYTTGEEEANQIDSGIGYTQSVQNYDIQYNKTHAMFRKIVLQSVATGDMSIKKPSELAPSGDLTDKHIKIKLWADPSPMGKPYARFYNINSSPFKYDSCVKGAQWVNNQLAFEGASGGVWNSINAGFSNAQAQRNYDQYITNARASLNANNRALSQAEEKSDSFISNLKGTIGQIGRNIEQYIPSMVTGGAAGIGAVAAGAGLETLPAAAPAVATATAALAGMQSARQSDLSLQNSISNMQDNQKLYQDNKIFAQQNLRQVVNENGIGLLRNNTLVSPSIMFSPDANLALYGYNHFIVYEVSMQGDDIVALDNYFIRFGYNGLHRPLVNSCFTKRQVFNYVQAYGVNIDSDWPMRVRQSAIAQLNAGVRVWKTKPTTDAYEANGNPSS